MSAVEKNGYYVSDGELWYVNDQSADEQSFILVEAGVRVVFLMAPSGDMYAYAARQGDQAFTFETWHTETAGGPPVKEGNGLYGTTVEYKGKTVYYNGTRWWSPAPIPAPGLTVYPCSENAAERLEQALSHLFPPYDKRSFLAGLALGRVLWKPPGL